MCYPNRPQGADSRRRIRLSGGFPRRNSAGFTLIELLVVIGIIVVLAAILFPVFATAREKARQSTCLSNLRQLGLAFAQYSTDYDGQYPTCDKCKDRAANRPPEPDSLTGDGSAERDWHITLQPYLKNLDILRCPSDTSKKPLDIANPNYAANEYAASYTLNGWAAYDLKDSLVTRPSQWILMGERNNATRPPTHWWIFYWWKWQGGIDAPTVFPPSLTPDPAANAAQDLSLTRHNNVPNWLYADGHVKSARFSDLWKAGAENAFWPTLPE